MTKRVKVPLPGDRQLSGSLTRPCSSWTDSHPGQLPCPKQSLHLQGDLLGSLVCGVLFLASSIPRSASVLTHSGAQVKSLKPVGLGFPRCEAGGRNPCLPSTGRAEAQGQGGKRAGPGAPAEGKGHCQSLHPPRPDGVLPAAPAARHPQLPGQPPPPS